MRDLSKRMTDVLKQTFPFVYRGTPEEIAESCIFEVFWRNGFDIPEYFIHHGEVISIETVERIYENGFAAIINDGKLIAFRKENVL